MKIVIRKMDSRKEVLIVASGLKVRLVMPENIRVKVRPVYSDRKTLPVGETTAPAVDRGFKSPRRC